MGSPVAMQSSRIHHFAFCTWSLPWSKQVVAASEIRLKLKCHSLSRAQLLKAARFNHLRHVILSASNLNEGMASGDRMKHRSYGQPNAEAILVVIEGICISIASVSCLASLTVHGSQDSRLVRSSVLEPIMPRKADLPLWQITFLLASLIINFILRARQRPSRDSSTKLTSRLMIADSSLETRVQKVEEEVASEMKMLQVLSKQLEKLAVRFRVTRQTLRDPIQKTAVLAQKASESINILAAREDGLEKNLEEMHDVLLRMQENQTKQLELISTLGRLVKDRPVKRVGNNSKTALSKSLEMGMQHIELERVDTDGNSILRNKIMTKSVRGAKMPSTVEDEKLDIEWTRQENPESSNYLPTLKSGHRARDTQRVDFWRDSPSSTQVEDCNDSNRKGHSSNDGRAGAAFLY